MAAMAAVSARRMRGPRVTGCHVVFGEEGHLFGGPAAFGADGDCRILTCSFGGCCSKRGLQGFGEGGGLFGFAEEDAGWGFFLFERWFEGCGVGDLGDVGAAGLLGGFEGDAAPAVYTFRGGLGEVFFGAAGEDGSDAGDA